MSHSLRLEELRSSLIQPVSLSLEAGACLALHGPSGAGKSLLMRAIADLDVCDGEVWLNQQARSSMNPSQWRRQVAYLPAESYWWEESVGSHAEHWNMEILQQLGFEQTVLSWQTARLSSGEKQRLALARALTNHPNALLLDEPTANLDAENTHALETVVSQYQEAQQIPVIWVSHDPEQRQRVANQVASINAGQLTWN
jgi:ABC-type iron transport system FetAB ATPase subunit